MIFTIYHQSFSNAEELNIQIINAIILNVNLKNTPKLLL